VLPGIERQPRKNLEPSPERLLALLHRWRDEAVRAGRTITGLRLPSKQAATASGWRAGLRCVGSRHHVIHPSSVALETRVIELTTVEAALLWQRYHRH
jgi:transposase